MPPRDAEDFEAEVLKEMTIERLDIDGIREKEVRLSEKDADDLSKRDRRMVLSCAKLEQQQESIFEILVKMNGQLMRTEANLIREQIAARNAQKEMDNLSIQARIIKWLAVTGGVAAIVEFVKWIGTKILKP